MAAHNLTRAEAGERARLITVQRNTVELDVTDGAGAPGAAIFRSISTIRFSCREPGAATFVDLTAPAVPEVTLNGRSLDPDLVFDGFRVAVDGLAADNELRVVADGAYMRTGEGLHRFVDPVDGEVYLYTQFETFDAHRIYACFDQPDLKAVFDLTVTAPAGWHVVSNGAATATPAPAAAQVVRFAPTPRISTYITALVAGPYHRVTDEHDGIPLGIYCRRSLAEHIDAERIFTETKQGFDFYHRVFDYRYPFGKYDQLFVPEFNAGAMENAAAVTFLEDYVFRSKVTRASYERRAETILHEMAHMWFGDLVTMRWWDDLWLNESFATYMSVLAQVEATEYTTAWTTFANLEKTWAYRQDQLPSTHPIAADMTDVAAVRVNFDGITYAKGASVLKQLVAWVGQDKFFAGVQAYFAKHAWGNTELRDLLSELEATSGRDLSAWSSLWLEQAGVTLLRPEITTTTDGGVEVMTSFAVLQETPASHPVQRPHRLVVGGYTVTTRADGSTALECTTKLELDVDGPRTEVPELVGQRRPDLVLVNDDDLAYAKMRLDDVSLATATAHLGSFTDSLPRTLVWTAAWDATRDGETPARSFVDLVLRNIGRESDSSVVQVLLRQLSTGVDLYVAPEHREATDVAVADRLLALATAAAAGSDTQLQLVKSFAGRASTPAHLDVVATILDGTRTLDGLTIDTDLRWELLTSLATGGRADEARIVDQLASDPTATGQRAAAAARAAIPTAEAKAAAWAAAVEDDELANAIQAATINGFGRVHDRSLLVPFVAPYFAALESVWESRTSEMAQNIVLGFYPTDLADDTRVDVLGATDAWLATHPDAVPALRRLIIESRDGVRRTLAAQEADRRRA